MYTGLKNVSFASLRSTPSLLELLFFVFSQDIFNRIEPALLERPASSIIASSQKHSIIQLNYICPPYPPTAIGRMESLDYTSYFTPAPQAFGYLGFVNDTNVPNGVSAESNAPIQVRKSHQ